MATDWLRQQFSSRRRPPALSGGQNRAACAQSPLPKQHKCAADGHRRAWVICYHALELNETDPERLARGLPAPGIARGEHHRVAERLQAAGRLVAKALVRSGDQGDGHELRLRRVCHPPARYVASEAITYD